MIDFLDKFLQFMEKHGIGLIDIANVIATVIGTVVFCLMLYYLWKAVG